MATSIRDATSTVSTDDEILTRSKDVWWYDQDITQIPEKAREVLEKYSHFPPDQVKDHVFQREKAWEIFPYPCIGGWRFLSLNLCTTPEYPEIISRLQNGEKLLDLGCCFGQELRRLIHDGAPAENLFGFDLRTEFFDLGCDLFRDKDRFTTTMMAGDIFQQPIPPELDKLVKGKISVIYAGAFFHLFDRPEQLYLAKLAGTLLKAAPGSMVIGRQVGDTNPSRYEHKTNMSGYMFRHNAESWREMWEEAGREQGIEWEVDAYLTEHAVLVEKQKPGRPLAPQLRFCVRRK